MAIFERLSNKLTFGCRPSDSGLPLFLRKISPHEARGWQIYGLLIFTFLLLFYTLFRLQAIVSLAAQDDAQAKDYHYGIVMDAGSSGTRAYLYYWPDHNGDKHELLSIQPLLEDGEPMVKKVSPGLSSQAETPEASFEYLRPLLQFASEKIPLEKHKETPLFILATAGMRLVEKTAQEAILSNVRKGIKENFQFYFPDGHLEIITGKQEGIYQWLSINYVLGKFKHKDVVGDTEELVAVEQGHAGENLVFRPRTVGAIDMGGASLQVAMEITSNLQYETLSDKDKAQVAEINLGCVQHDTEHTYRLFVTTYLGFGANEAMARHQRSLFLGNFIKDGSGLEDRRRIKDPCRASGMKENATINLDLENLNINESLKGQLQEQQEVHFYGTGDFDGCFKLLENFTRVRDPYLLCQENCPDSKMRPPPIQFEKSEFYGFSEFWYSMEDVLEIGGQYQFYKYRTAAKDFCSTRWMTTWARFQQGTYPNSDTERLQTQCFKSAWLTAALHEGLMFPLGYSSLTAAPNTVHGQVVHWTLGALLYRTRFFPLRAIERLDSNGSGVHHSALAHGYLHSAYIIGFCFCAVLIFILLYVIRLERYVKPSTLRKVPSLAMFTGSQDLEETLLRKEQDYLYSHTKVFVG